MKTLETEQIIKQKRRNFGEHLTSVKIFQEYIFPYIKKDIYNYIWIDLYAGEGNLILPILEYIPHTERINFFRERIFLFDIQSELVEKSITNAKYYGIPEKIARENIVQKDTLQQFPKNILGKKLPIFHITNPPYLYIGYIVKQGGRNLKYFDGVNEGYQDLYQIALINDLRNGIGKMIYIIPSNFLFGDSCSNKIRNDFLKFYDIQKVYFFENKIFEYTGTHVGIFFFERRECICDKKLRFIGIKIKNGDSIKREYILKPENNYRAGNNFEEFIKKYKAKREIKVKFYLTEKSILENKGNEVIEVINANKFNGKSYKREFIEVSVDFKKKILSNILFVRTVDTGTLSGRAGLYEIKEVFGVDGIFVSNTFRTHPIQIFFSPTLSINDQIYLKKYFNLLLEYFRKIDDSEFLTTFKYSETEYTRKYMGLTRVKELIQTFPILDLSEKNKMEFRNFIDEKDTEKILKFIKDHNAEEYSDLFLKL
ncbi:MAG TPA: N-6 DNA methylase [Candidatus Hydrogenedens sp.]|nr:N-6 DNA methylase [Candidatus Hydrogenedens sp.]